MLVIREDGPGLEGGEGSELFDAVAERRGKKAELRGIKISSCSA